MSNLRVNNVNIGGTSVDGVIQQVDSQGTPNTAGNKITLKTDGTNTVDGDTAFSNIVTCNKQAVFNDTVTCSGDASFSGNTTTEYIKFAYPQANISTANYYGQVVNLSNGETVTISPVTVTGGGGIITIINSSQTANVTINKTAAPVITIHIGTGIVSASSLTLAPLGMCTIFAIPAGTWISGVGLS
jgi:hypothetical protein